MGNCQPRSAETKQQTKPKQYNDMTTKNLTKSFRASAAQTGKSGSTQGAGVLADEKKGETHDCKGKNSCKGKGGCKGGDNGCALKNSCKGKGGCAVKDGKPVHPKPAEPK